MYVFMPVESILVSGMGTFVCEQCGKEFSARSNLSRHHNSHNINKETLICDTCDFTSNTKRSMVEHKERVHSSLLLPL